MKKNMKIIILVVVIFTFLASCTKVETLKNDLSFIDNGSDPKLDKILITRNDLGKAVELTNKDDILKFVNLMKGQIYIEKITQNEVEKRGVALNGIKYQISLYSKGNRKIGSILYGPGEDLLIIRYDTLGYFYFLKNKIHKELEEYFTEGEVYDL